MPCGTCWGVSVLFAHVSWPPCAQAIMVDRTCCCALRVFPAHDFRHVLAQAILFSVISYFMLGFDITPGEAASCSFTPDSNLARALAGLLQAAWAGIWLILRGLINDQLHVWLCNQPRKQTCQVLMRGALARASRQVLLVPSDHLPHAGPHELLRHHGRLHHAGPALRLDPLRLLLRPLARHPTPPPLARS